MNLQIKRKNTYSDANHTQHISSGSDWSLNASCAFSQHTKKYRKKLSGCSHCCWHGTTRNPKFKKANPQQTKHWVFPLIPACLRQLPPRWGWGLEVFSCCERDNDTPLGSWSAAVESPVMLSVMLSALTWPETFSIPSSAPSSSALQQYIYRKTVNYVEEKHSPQNASSIHSFEVTKKTSVTKPVNIAEHKILLKWQLRRRQQQYSSREAPQHFSADESWAKAQLEVWTPQILKKGDFYHFVPAYFPSKNPGAKQETTAHSSS